MEFGHSIGARPLAANHGDEIALDALLERRGHCFLALEHPSGRVYLLDSAGKRGQRPKLALDTDSQFSALGEDADGELYIADYGPGNTIYRITGRRP